jgi:hypothetical protein
MNAIILQNDNKNRSEETIDRQTPTGKKNKRRKTQAKEEK